MSILGTLIANPLDGEKKPWKPWYGYLFLVMLVVGGGLYVYQRVNGGPVVPTFTDPATVYENAKAARERQEQGASGEAEGASTDEMLSDIAKAALDIIEETPIIVPNAEDLNGDAVEVAAWIEANHAALNATVIEDPSADEIAAYLAEGIPVYVPVIFTDEAEEHWVMLDAASQPAVLEVMIGNRVVIVEAK